MTLEILTSDALGSVKHGFFTRKGGASSGIYAGLNCGFGSDDQSDAVRINRARVEDAMGAPLFGVHQIHSTDVAVAPAQNPADAIVTNEPDKTLFVLTADCQPVLFHDPEHGVIGAAHAGWKGALTGVLENTISAMEALGAKRDTIRATIGPCLSQDNYEVGPEFITRLLEHTPENERFFKAGQNGHAYFDLPAYGLMRLHAAGLTSATWTGHCTYADPDRFYSYRRSVHKKEGDYGRLLSAIRL